MLNEKEQRLNTELESMKDLKETFGKIKNLLRKGGVVSPTAS